jgi:hypothetical protein
MNNILSTKKLIVVLGAGRSGTSLVMRALSNFGMTVSSEMTLSSVQNPTGTYEDSQIFKVHSDILENFKTNQYLPLPENWLDNKVIRESIKKLSSIIANEVDNAQTIWGFKDPRTALFLPMWNKIFNKAKVVPIYILAVRDPISVVNSLKLQYSYKEEVSELFWLHKNCEALFCTGANCFIVHYEEWFSHANEIIAKLLNYTGLNVYCKDINIDESLKEVINPNLNRSIYGDYEIRNEYVLKLYDVLRTCRGSDFHKSTLMQIVEECRRVMDGFKGWLIQSRQLIEIESSKRAKIVKSKFEDQLINEKKNRETTKLELDRQRAKFHELENKLEKVISEKEKSVAHINDLENKIGELVKENNKLMILQKDLSDYNLESFRKVSILNPKSMKLNLSFKEKFTTLKRKGLIIKPKFKKFNFILNKNILFTNFNINSIIFNPQTKWLSNFLFGHNKQNSNFMRSVIGKFIWKLKYKDLLNRYSNQELNIRIAERMRSHVKKWGPIADKYNKKSQ